MWFMFLLLSLSYVHVFLRGYSVQRGGCCLPSVHNITFWMWVIPSCPDGGELLVAIGSCADFTYVLGAHRYGECCGRFGVG